LFKSVILAGASLLTFAAGAVAADQGPRPMFAVQPTPRSSTAALRPTKLPTWTFAWTYKGAKYNAIFVGHKPSTGTPVTVPVYIIPVKLTYGTTVADPTAKDSSGKSAIDYTVASPIFDSTTNYTQGGTNVGTTQYEDAFERAALWKTVQTQTGYHVLLGTPKVEPLQSFTVPKADGTVATAFGVKVVIANINWFDPQIEPLVSSLKIPANALPIFVTTQAYLSENSSTSGCCIGGYHSYTGTQAYSHFTFIQKSGAFAQDVSALSHEVGEWMNDPLTNNTHIPSSCAANGNGLYENGDPLEGEANYGSYPYVVGGVTYHLQDLVMPPYFGAPVNTSVNGWSTFQGTKLAVCQNGG
jgi:hypothetical protein